MKNKTDDGSDTINVASPRRIPAEWEGRTTILLAWPHVGTDWAPLLAEARECVMAIARAVASTGHPLLILAPKPTEVRRCLADIDRRGLLNIVEYTTNDTWARDFGPITTEMADGAAMPIDFQFNGWGLKFAADRDNLVNLALHRAAILPLLENRRSFILEGGSIDSDGRGLVITTTECLLSPNRNGSTPPGDIDSFLKRTLGVKDIIWLNNGSLAGDDTDSHIDTLARFAPGGKLIHCVCLNTADPNHGAISAMADEIADIAPQYGLTPVPLPLPDPIFDSEDGHQLPATYANFLALDNAVVIPTYGQPEADARAEAIIAEAFGLPVIPVDCQVLIRQHGSLHCMTMQIPSQALNL